MKRSLIIILFIIPLLAATAAIANQPITISAGAGAMSGSLNIAAAKGFLKDEGVNGKVISYKKGKIAFDKYLAGEDDFATCNIVAIVLTDFDITQH